MKEEEREKAAVEEMGITNDDVIIVLVLPSASFTFTKPWNQMSFEGLRKATKTNMSIF